MRSHNLRAAAGSAGGGSGDIALSHIGSPYISVYQWSPSGFGSKYSNPSTLPAYNSFGPPDFSPDGSALAVPHAFSPHISVYPWSSSGFGTKYSNPSTAAGSNGYQAAFSPDGSYLAVAVQNSPRVAVYSWSSSGFGTRYSNMVDADKPQGTAKSVAFTPDGANLAVGHDNSPYISVYPWDSGFGAKYSDPSTLPTNSVRGIAFLFPDS